MRLENEDFLAEYRAEVAGRASELLRGAPPTLVRIDEALVLRHDRRRWRAPVLDQDYRQLMRASHVPALMALVHRPGEPFPEPVRGFVGALRDGVEAGPAAALLARCAELLAAPPLEQWTAAAAGVDALLGACIDAAARAELRNLDAATRRLLDLCGDARARVVFVVCDGHQPRYRQLSKQYFARLLGIDPESAADGEERLVYAEHRDEEEALRLVAAQAVDRELALRIWGEPTRMQRDVLGDAARAALEGFETPRAR